MVSHSFHRRCATRGGSPTVISNRPLLPHIPILLCIVAPGVNAGSALHLFVCFGSLLATLIVCTMTIRMMRKLMVRVMLKLMARVMVRLRMRMMMRMRVMMMMMMMMMMVMVMMVMMMVVVVLTMVMVVTMTAASSIDYVVVAVM